MPSYIHSHYRKVPDTPCNRAVIERELHLYKKGTLKSGKTGKKVKKKSQATAIALSEARKECKYYTPYGHRITKEQYQRGKKLGLKLHKA